MAHSYTSTLIHCVFSTKERRKTIQPELQAELWAYMGGIARTRNMKALAVGGIEDHAHILLLLPSNVAVASAVQKIKAGSSKWLHEARRQRDFEWQEGYGAFSIGTFQAPATVSYILRQKAHHLKQDFCVEYLGFLAKHQIEYDPRFVWG